MTADEFFDVLRIDVFAGGNDQIFFTADNEELSVYGKAEITRPIPAFSNCRFREVGPVVVTFEQ